MFGPLLKLRLSHAGKLISPAQTPLATSQQQSQRVDDTASTTAAAAAAAAAPACTGTIEQEGSSSPSALLSPKLKPTAHRLNKTSTYDGNKSCNYRWGMSFFLILQTLPHIYTLDPICLPAGPVAVILTGSVLSVPYNCSNLATIVQQYESPTTAAGRIVMVSSGGGGGGGRGQEESSVSQHSHSSNHIHHGPGNGNYNRRRSVVQSLNRLTLPLTQ